MKYEIRPLGTWPEPVTEQRQSSGMFRAGWEATLQLLRDEVDQLDGEYPIMIQIDVQDVDVRQDGMLRTRARVGPFPGVIVSFTSRHGPLRYTSDAYEQRYMGSLPGWQANVRAIALALGALRAVDRYGVTKKGEQYVGWKALPAGDGLAFGGPQEALTWMRRVYGSGSAVLTASELYKQLARSMHPDAGGSRDDWDRLGNARQLLVTGGML